jgi:hypothetical protein
MLANQHTLVWLAADYATRMFVARVSMPSGARLVSSMQAENAARKPKSQRRPTAPRPARPEGVQATGRQDDMQLVPTAQGHAATGSGSPGMTSSVTRPSLAELAAVRPGSAPILEEAEQSDDPAVGGGAAGNKVTDGALASSTMAVQHHEKPNSTGKGSIATLRHLSPEDLDGVMPISHTNMHVWTMCKWP